MNTYEQDLIIASEEGYAVASGEDIEDIVINRLDCPICHNHPDYLEIIDAENHVVCDKCGAIYEIKTKPEISDYRLDPDFDPDSETEAERACMERY